MKTWREYPGLGTVGFAVLALLSWSGLTSASTVTGTIGSPYKISSQMTVTSESSTVSGAGGEFTLNISSVSGDPLPPLSDYVWCIEPSESINLNQNPPTAWELVELTGAPKDGPTTTMSTQQAEDLSKLFGEIYPSTPITGLPSGTAKQFIDAFQLAIWEIANEQLPVADTPSYDLDAGSFVYGGGAVLGAQTLAQGWLDDLNDGTADSWAKANLLALTNSGDQDFVVGVVPLPAAGWLFGSALLGTLMFARGRRREDEA